LAWLAERLKGYFHPFLVAFQFFSLGQACYFYPSLGNNASYDVDRLMSFSMLFESICKVLKSNLEVFELMVYRREPEQAAKQL